MTDNTRERCTVCREPLTDRDAEGTYRAACSSIRTQWCPQWTEAREAVQQARWLREALLRTRDALHRACLERGSTDGFRDDFAAASEALADQSQSNAIPTIQHQLGGETYILTETLTLPADTKALDYVRRLAAEGDPRTISITGKALNLAEPTYEWRGVADQKLSPRGDPWSSGPCASDELANGKLSEYLARAGGTGHLEWRVPGTAPGEWHRDEYPQTEAPPHAGPRCWIVCPECESTDEATDTPCTNLLCPSHKRRGTRRQERLEDGPVEAHPGVMHPTDQTFYDLVVKERDHERRMVDNLKTQRMALQDKLTEMKLHDATNHPYDDGYMRAWQEITDFLADSDV